MASFSAGSVGMGVGGFHVSITGNTGHGFEVYTTTNLSGSWQLLTTLSNVAPTILFTDPSTNSAQRFYKARQLP